MKSALRGASLIVALFATTSAVEAQTTFSGFSTGSFTNGVTTGLSALGGLTFGAPNTPWSFDLALGQTLTPVSFGTLYLDRAVSYNYGSGGNKYFNINLTFTAPGGGNQVFVAALSGNINHNENGQVNVHFNGPFTASLAGGYSVEVSLNSITGANGFTSLGGSNYATSLRGSIKYVDGPPVIGGGGDPGTTTTPEPVTMILLGSGLAGVAAARRRRRTALELA
jgi:hypothetical protein